MGKEHVTRHGHPATSDSAGLQDPVCGMEVGPETARRFLHAGTDYLFCSAGCLAKFRESPGLYISAEGGGETSRQVESAEGKIVRGAEYTCPMHPEVRQEGPGSCPKCGMALEPVVPVSRREWTCPMHPEVVRDAPGDCPKCGMVLEPRTLSAEEEENAELVDMRRRFWVSAVLTVPLFLVAMADFIPRRPLQNLP